MTKNPRAAAAEALYNIEKEGEYSNRAMLDAARGLDVRDTALATEIVMGVLRNKLYIDFIIQSYSKIKLKKISPWVLQILRCGVYQLVMMDKIPPSAACNEAVKLAAGKSNGAARGFVNGVLRTVSRNIEALPVPNGSTEEILSVKYSCPLWIVKRLCEQYGTEMTECILTDSLIPHSTTVRTNILKTSSAELVRILEEEGICAEQNTEIPECIRVFGAFDINRSAAYSDGLYTIQNINSMRAGLLLDPREGETVLDLCAAPGGKTTHLAELMKNKGKITAFDLHPHKAELINNAARRLGIGIIEVRTADCTEYMPELDGCADRVLADVPCSGMGVIHKKPDIKYNRRTEDVETLCSIQEKIMNNGARYLKPGGVMVYSTCTIFKEENERQTERFLNTHDNFVKEHERLYTAHETGGSGFYLCRFKKVR